MQAVKFKGITVHHYCDVTHYDRGWLLDTKGITVHHYCDVTLCVIAAL